MWSGLAAGAEQAGDHADKEHGADLPRVFVVFRPYIPGQPIGDARAPVPLQAAQPIAHRMKRAFTGAQVYRLIRRILRHCRQAGELQPLLNFGHIGIADRARLKAR
jgi:hypothetical protein